MSPKAWVRPGQMGHGLACMRWLQRLLVALALLMPTAGAYAQEPEVRALQENLTKLGLYAGPVDGEQSETLAAAIAAYVRQAGFREPAASAFRHFGALVRDVDLETRIRAGHAKVAGRQQVATRFGALEIVTYRQADAPAGFADGRRVSLAGQRVDAGLAAFATCCEAKVFQVGEADVAVLRGAQDAPSCEIGRVYVSVRPGRLSVTDGEDSCAPEPHFAVENGRLAITALARNGLIDARWSLIPGEPMRFERLVIGASLEPLAWWVGRQPTERVERGYRFFHFAPLADALSALLEPEALGWTLKMTLTTPVERRGEVLFTSGSYQPDERLVSVTVDLANRAVHACSFNRGTTRFASTLLRGVFSDPASSCPADIEGAVAAWTALGVLPGTSTARVFGFEGVFGDEEACKAGGDRVTRITARSLKVAGEAELSITEVGLSDGDYVVGTTGRTVPIKRLDDDRIDLDGEVMRRCPNSP
jgi:hypothetical protein